MGNLETPLAGPVAGYSSIQYSFNTPDSFAEALRNAGIKIVSTANNHALDRDLAGLERTLDILDQYGIFHTGTARTPDERNKLLIRDINGIKVGFLACTYGTNAFVNQRFLKEKEAHAVNLIQPQETLPGSVHLLNSFETIASDMARRSGEETPFLQQLQKDADALRKAGSDYIVLLLHCGGQYNPEPDPYTLDLVRKITRTMDVDLIVGNHPHVIQHAEMLNGVPVFYCLGNFIDSPWKTPGTDMEHFVRNSMLVQIELEKEEGGTKLRKYTVRFVRFQMDGAGFVQTVPLYDLYRNASGKEQEFWKTQIQLCLQAFLGDDASGMEIRESYDFPPESMKKAPENQAQ